jgi:hypothetical protein
VNTICHTEWNSQGNAFYHEAHEVHEEHGHYRTEQRAQSTAAIPWGPPLPPVQSLGFQLRGPSCASWLKIILGFSKNFGNISEKQPFFERISDLFFCGLASKRWACRADSSSIAPIGATVEAIGRRWVSQSQSNRCGEMLKAEC